MTPARKMAARSRPAHRETPSAARAKATRKKAARKKAAKKASRKKAVRKKAVRKKAVRKKATHKQTSKKAAHKKATRKQASHKQAVHKRVTRKKAARKKATRKKAVKKAVKKAAKKAVKKATRKKAVRRRRPRIDPERAATVVHLLATHDPDPKCALDHANPFELLVATILSAQCTDVRVNMVTPQLFSRWPTAADLAGADQPDLEEVIHSTGFFRNKAKNLIGMATRLEEVHGGQVPRAMDELLALPGVARKTANVVRGECFGLADGVVVDTHVNRIAGRLGFSRERDPVKVERDLMAIVPQDHWIAFSHRLIRLGRTICPARKPRCETCYLQPHCPRVGVRSAT